MPSHRCIATLVLTAPLLLAASQALSQGNVTNATTGSAVEKADKNIIADPALRTKQEPVEPRIVAPSSSEPSSERAR